MLSTFLESGDKGILFYLTTQMFLELFSEKKKNYSPNLDMWLKINLFFLLFDCMFEFHRCSDRSYNFLNIFN